MEYKVIGNISDIAILRKMEPDLNMYEIEQLLDGRQFARWYCKNKNTINALALIVPSFTLAMFGIEPSTLSYLLQETSAVPVIATEAYANYQPDAIETMAKGGGYSFWAGHGAILLHMLIIGFVTLIVTTFLKFTGRGDIAPLVVFVGGGIILYEVIGLFRKIYEAVATFFNL